MKVANITISKIRSAIKSVNKKYGYRIEFKAPPTVRGDWIHFTIRSEKSGIPGSKLGVSGRRTYSASWHAHGYLFDEMIKESPDVVIRALGRNITANGGNWIDFNVDSLYHPIMNSELSIL